MKARSKGDVAADYVECYLRALGEPDFLRAVYLDLTPGIAIYTVYSDTFEAAAGTMLDAEIAAIDTFPDVPVNFATVDMAHRDAVVPGSAHRVFPVA